jgi:hypothetical protein
VNFRGEIHNQPLNHLRNPRGSSMITSSPSQDGPRQLPMQRSLTSDKSDVSGAICKDQMPGSEESVRIITPCVYFLTSIKVQKTLTQIGNKLCMDNSPAPCISHGCASQQSVIMASTGLSSCLTLQNLSSH